MGSQDSGSFIANKTSFPEFPLICGNFGITEAGLTSGICVRCIAVAKETCGSGDNIFAQPMATGFSLSLF